GADEHAGIDAAGAVFDGRVQAWVDSSPAQGYDRADVATRMYVVAEVEPAPVSVQRAREGSSGSVLSFAPGTLPVTVRLATSYLGLVQVQRSPAQELAGRSFDQIREAAHAAWAERLQVIEAPDATRVQRRTPYANLYRLNLYPSSHWENAGTAERPEPVHASPVL